MKPVGGPLGPRGETFSDDGVRRNPSNASNQFQHLFQKELNKSEPLRWSKHARSRLNESRIQLSETDLQRLNNAVAKASDKGARESLVLLDDVAFVVSVKNKTVITAVPSERMKNNVFTNIDSAVIT